MPEISEAIIRSAVENAIEWKSEVIAKAVQRAIERVLGKLVLAAFAGFIAVKTFEFIFGR